MKWIVRFVENHLWFVEHTHALEGKRGWRFLIWVKWMYHAMKWDRKEQTLRKPNRHYIWQSVRGSTRIDIEDVPRRSSNE